MKYLKIFMAWGTMILVGPSIQAQQGETKMGLNYSVAMPAGSFHDFIGKTTGRSFNITILHGISDQLSLGADIGYRDFYEKYPRQVYKTTDGSDISAVVSNSVQAIPIMAKVRYGFLPHATVQPFVGAGAGVNLISLQQYLGEYSNLSRNAAGFVASPELGIHIPVGKEKMAGIDLSAAYYYMPYRYASVSGLDHASVQLGVSFPLRR